MRPVDTRPEAYRVQVGVFRSMSPERRLQLAMQLTEVCRKIVGDGVRFRHPTYSDDEVRLAVIRLQLGDKLFRRAYPQHANLKP